MTQFTNLKCHHLVFIYCGQLMVNWWFGILAVPVSNNPFQTKISGPVPDQSISVNARRATASCYSYPTTCTQCQNCFTQGMQAVDTSRAKLIICFVIRRRICFASRSGQVLPRDYSSPVKIWLGHVVCQRRFHHPSPHMLVLDHAQVSHTVFGHISSRSQKVQPTIGRVRGSQLPIRATHTQMQSTRHTSPINP